LAVTVGTGFRDDPEKVKLFGEQLGEGEDARLAAGSFEPGHDHHVAGVELVEQAAMLRTVGFGSAHHFARHPARPVFPQGRDLRRDPLPVWLDARIAVDHGVILHQKSEPKSVIESMLRIWRIILEAAMSAI
jgi:hypothetical protein